TRVRLRGVRLGGDVAVDGALTTQGDATSATSLGWTTGVFKTAVVMVNLANRQLDPDIDVASTEKAMKITSDFFLENSYGTTSLDSHVYGTFTLPMSMGPGDRSCDLDQVETLTRQAATKAGVDLGGVQRLVIVFPGWGCATGYGDIGGGKPAAWI